MLAGTLPSMRSAAYERLRQAVRDAITFVWKLPNTVGCPCVGSNESGEIVLEWRLGDREAVVGFDGDGKFGYALLRDGTFVPGKHEGLIDADPPPDLILYLTE